MTERKILLVSYYFPPLGGVGAFRAVKLSRHLPRLGWTPHVLTPEAAHYYCIDESLLATIPPEVKIHRTESLDPFRLYARLRGRRPEPVADATASDPFFGRITRLAKSVNTWLFVPDNKIGWLPFAAAAGKRIVKREGIDLVYTINVPQTCHLIGRAIKRATGVAWAADFRDAWTANPDLRPPTPIHRSITGSQERSVLREADLVVAVNDTVRDLLYHAGGGDGGKYLTVHNGYDPDDFDELRRSSHDRFTMVFVGTFHKRTDPRLLLRPFAKAIEAGEIPSGRARLVVVGAQTAGAREAAAELGIEANVEFTGFLAHRESLSWMASADVLVQLIAPGPGSDQIVSGKLYEYMAARRPVLTIGPAGEARAMVEKLRLGSWADVADEDAVRRSLIALFEQKQSGGIKFSPDQAAVEAHSFPSQTEILSRRLQEAIKNCRDLQS